MQSQYSLETLLAMLKQRGDVLYPCTGADIREIETKTKFMLPDEYKKFLLAMGREAGWFLRGSSCLYPNMIGLNEAANHLLAENNLPPLPPDAFVFWMHQGYMFAFFKLNDPPHLPVYFFTEAKPHSNFYVEETLWHFLCKQVGL